MLFAILSALALCASIIRLIAQVQMFSSVGAPFPGNGIIYMEIGNWLAWTLWGVVVAWTVSRYTSGERPVAARALVILALGVAPILLVPLFVSPVHVLAMNGPTLGGSFHHVVTHNAPTNVLLSVAMLGVTLFYTAQQRERSLALTTAGLRAQLAESQLSALRSQMDPHFLFNALNGIAVLARRGQNAAVEKMVNGLASLLRYSLETASAQLVPLRVDLDALQHYLDVEGARFGSRLTVALDVPEALLGRMVPSFLLQPIAENAIRHGFDEASRPLHIEVVARDNAGGMTIVVTDDGVGLVERAPVNDGIGLGNTRARLTGLFGPKASLALEPGDAKRGVRVTITIPPSEPS